MRVYVRVCLFVSVCVCLCRQEAVSSLANEIRWVDEEGLKARLDAEADLRTRITALVTRVDDMEEAHGAALAHLAANGAAAAAAAASSAASGGSSTRSRGGPSPSPMAGRERAPAAPTALAQQSSVKAPVGLRGDASGAPISRDTLIKHVRVWQDWCLWQKPVLFCVLVVLRTGTFISRALSPVLLPC